MIKAVQLTNLAVKKYVEYSCCTVPENGEDYDSRKPNPRCPLRNNNVGGVVHNYFGSEEQAKHEVGEKVDEFLAFPHLHILQFFGLVVELGCEIDKNKKTEQELAAEI